jgi:uncharacterized membrane protein YfcA
MTPVEFAAVTLAVSMGAGIFGSVLGLGGGIIVVPALTLLLHIDIRYAIGASIVSVIATSSGAGVAYVKERLTNIRVSMLLETATTPGAVLGALLAGIIAGRWLYLVFGLVLAYAAYEMWRRPHRAADAVAPTDRWSARLRLSGSYHDAALDKEVPYHASRTPWGLALSGVAGILSGLLGVGGGIIKVPAMNLVMGLPIKVASATSNFMIGVTAAASAGVYFLRGDINPFIAGPVAIGVVVGALIGTHILNHLRRSVLRVAFTAVLVFVAIQMLWKGWL